MSKVVNSFSLKNMSQALIREELKELAPSAQAKAVAGFFIARLSEEGSPLRQNYRSAELLSSEDKVYLATQITPEIARSLNGRKPDGHFFLIGEGSHNTVWGHPSYENVVFKILRKEDAVKQERVAQKAGQINEEMEGAWVLIPKATSIELEEFTAYVEERLPLILDINQHIEFWGRVLAYYQSSECNDTFKSNLQSLISQLQNLIEKVGFWDVGNKNLPEVCMDGEGVCGTDFENINEDLSNVAEGLERLATLVPVSPLVDEIVLSYKQKEKDSRQLKDFDAHLQNKLEHLIALQEAITVYDRREYITGEEELKLNADLSTLSREELFYAQWVMQKIQEYAHGQEFPGFSRLGAHWGNDFANTQPIHAKRYIYVQPGCSIGVKNFTSHDTLAKVLAFLKEQQVIISWASDVKFNETTERDTFCSTYTIHF